MPGSRPTPVAAIGRDRVETRTSEWVKLGYSSMTSRSRPTQAKRAREKALQEKRQQKAARRQDAKERKETSPRRADGVDPDIADIVPGPQPHPFLDVDEIDTESN